MKKPQSFQIDADMKMRSSTAADEPLAAQWMEEDDAHRGLFPASFWTQQDNPAADTFVFEDRDGALMFVRLERVTRVLIQYPPMKDAETRLRCMSAMRRGIEWLVAALGVNGQCGLIFDTKSPWLSAFAKRRLRFREYSGVLLRGVPVYTPPEPPRSPGPSRP